MVFFFFNSWSQLCWKARNCLAEAQGEQSKWLLSSNYKKRSYFLQKLGNEARNDDNSESHSSRQTGMLPLTSCRVSSGWQMISERGLICHSCHSTDTGATSAKRLLSADVSGQLDFLWRKALRVVPVGHPSQAFRQTGCCWRATENMLTFGLTDASECFQLLAHFLKP